MKFIPIGPGVLSAPMDIYTYPLIHPLTAFPITHTHACTYTPHTRTHAADVKGAFHPKVVLSEKTFQQVRSEWEQGKDVEFIRLLEAAKVVLCFITYSIFLSYHMISCDHAVGDVGRL